MQFNLNSFQSIWQRWQYNAGTIPNKDAIVHWRAGEEPVRISYSALLKRANEYSVMLKENGVKEGEVCAVIIRHHPEFFPLYLGIAGMRAIPAVLAYPNPRLHPDKFRQGLEGMSHRSGLDWILTERELEPVINPLAVKEGSTIKGVQFPLEWKVNSNVFDKDLAELKKIREKIKREDPLLLQHSSGTTGLQKPVLLSNRAVLDHVVNLSTALDFNEKDKIVSWLPLYHDMGLIGAFHFTMAAGSTLIQLDPFEWVLSPVLLLDAISKEKATISWVPNFSYNVMTDKVHDDELEGLNLESMRLMISCSEPVRNESNQKFYEKYAKYGFKKTALSSSYAMAETTFAVTQTPSGEEIKTLKIDREGFRNGKYILAENSGNFKVCCSSGILINGCDMRVVDENRKDIQKGLIGELAIKSVSMFDGYRNYPEKTAEAVDNKGWYYSGDYGFEHEGHWYVIGRKKDIVIVGGINVYPEDVEDVVGQVKGVIPGRVVAFAEEDEKLGTEHVGIIAETNLELPDEKKKLRLDIVKAGMGIDVSIYKIYLVPSRWLIKSSAGKPSRKQNRERISEPTEKQKWIVI